MIHIYVYVFVTAVLCHWYFKGKPVMTLVLQLLEYTGRGKNITDVGLAQARHPLNTTNHYFEIEIIDPGENCYIAIGLARKVSGCSCCTRLVM